VCSDRIREKKVKKKLKNYRNRWVQLLQKVIKMWLQGETERRKRIKTESRKGPKKKIH
jgi:hypothetical protein